MALSRVAVRAPPKYGPEYTRALKNQVPGLIVLGDDVPLLTNLAGWHAKMELFAPWNAFLRPLLYFDLDTYVFTDLREFEILDPTKFWMIRDFNRPERGESGLMIVPDDEKFCEKVFTTNISGPDGAYLRDFPHSYLNDAIPGIYSYKNHCKTGIPDDARIICFHGTPKPPETEGWAHDWWMTHT